MERKVTKIIERHIASDKIIESVSMTTDYKTNNREAKKLNRLYEELSKDINLAKEVYKVLLDSECVTTRGISSVECLRLGIYIEKAINNLEEISQMKDIGIRSLSAEMALKIWRGEIKGQHL